MHTHAVDDMQVALRHSCRRQCLPYAGARFAQYAELLDPAESWEQGGFIPPPMSRGAIPQVAREFRIQFESHHPADGGTPTARRRKASWPFLAQTARGRIIWHPGGAACHAHRHLGQAGCSAAARSHTCADWQGATFCGRIRRDEKVVTVLVWRSCGARVALVWR